MQAQRDNITSGFGQPEVRAQATAAVDVDDADQNAETMAVIAFENAIAAKDAANATPNGGWHELAVSSLIVGPGGAKADVTQSADDDEQATLSQVRAGIFPPVQAPVVEPLTNNATVVHREEIPNPLLEHANHARRQRFIQRQRQLDVEFFKSTIRPYEPPQREEPIPMSPLEAVIRDPINAIAIQESLSMHIARMRVDRERRAAREAAVAVVVPVGGSVSDDEDGEDASSSSIQRRPKEEEEEVVERWVPAPVVVKKEEVEVDDKRLLRPKREPLAELRLVRVKREADQVTNDIKPKREPLGEVLPAAKVKVEDDEDDVKTEVDDDECARAVAFLDMLEKELDDAREEALAIAGGPRHFRTGPLKRTYAVADLNAVELEPAPPAPAPTTYGRVLADVTRMFVMEEVVEVEVEDADGERPAKRRCLLEGEDGAEDLFEVGELEGDEDYPEDATDGSMAVDVDPSEEIPEDGHDFVVYEGPVVYDDDEEDVEIGGLSSDEEENDENVFDEEVKVEENLEGHDFVVYEGPEVDEEVEEAEEEVEGGELSSDEEENDENAF